MQSNIVPIISFSNLQNIPTTLTGHNITLIPNDIPNLPASILTSGLISTARLGSGTANSSTFLRGDNSWVTIPPTLPGGSSGSIQYNNGSGSFAGGAATIDSSGNAIFNTVTVAPLYVPVTYVLQPGGTQAKDTWIRGESPDINEGISGILGVGQVGGVLIRSLIQFDLSFLTSNTQVTSATLSLWANSDNSTNARTLHVYRIKRAWTEGTGNGNASGDGATWNTYDGINTWQTAGGSGVNDREQTDIGHINLSASETLGAFKDITLTGATIADLDLGHGWILQDDTESSDEYSYDSGQSLTGSQRPKLTITVLQVAPTYSQIFHDNLRVNNSNNGVDGTLRTIIDGGGIASALTVASGDVGVNGIFHVNQGSGRAFTLSTRDAVTTFPAVGFRPDIANSVLALDLMPNGTPTEFGLPGPGQHGFAWFDVCNVDCKTGNPPITTARIGVRSDCVEFGSRTFNGGTTLPVFIGINGIPAITISTSNNVNINTGTLSMGGTTVIDSAFNATFASITGTISDATTTVQNVATFVHNSTAGACGTGIKLQGQSSTTPNRDMILLSSSWGDSTDSNRSSGLLIQAYKFASPFNLFNYDAVQSSLAIGQNTSAAGAQSTAIGISCSAGDDGATAVGRGAFASGYRSTALGYYTSASGIHSVALGSGTDGGFTTGNSLNHALSIGFIQSNPTTYFRGGASYSGVGTVSTTSGSAAVVGISTTFTADFIIGTQITIGANTYSVLSVTDSTHLTLTTNAGATVSGSAYTIVPELFTLFKADGTTTMFVDPTGAVTFNGTARIDTNGNIFSSGSQAYINLGVSNFFVANDMTIMTGEAGVGVYSLANVPFRIATNLNQPIIFETQTSAFAPFERFRINNNGVTASSYDAAIATVSNPLTLTHNPTSGTGGASGNGYGTGILFQGQDSTTASQSMAQQAAIWTTATHASRTSALTWSLINNAGSLTEYLRLTPTSLSAFSGLVTITNNSGNGLISSFVNNPVDPDPAAISGGAVLGFNNTPANFFGIGIGAVRSGRYNIWLQTGATNGGGYSFYVGGGIGVLNEKFTIDYQGNIGIGTPSQFGSGAGVIGIADRTTAPSTNPTGGVVVYSDSGTLKTKRSNGVISAVGSLIGYTVSTLPTATVGDVAYVTDALAPTYLSIIVGGGAIVTPVFYNGTNWVCH